MAVSYEWDAANNLTRLTWPDGFAVDYEWDANNRVSQAKDGARVLASVAYDALSRRQSVTYGNGTSVYHGYSSRGDLIDHDLSFAGPAGVNYDYAYNGVGQLLSRTVSDPGFNWLPLASATDSYAVNGLNQYTSIAGASPVYDGNGNLTTDHNGRSFVYDAENVLRTASGLASGAATYRYHADGARRQKIYDGTTTEFYYMGGLGYLDEEDTQFAADQEIAEYSGGALARRYIRLPGSVDETFLMIDMSRDASCTTTSYANCEVWAQADRIGSVVATTDASGAVVEKYRYSPYGKSGHEGDSGFPFRFTGQKLDAETGLYYYKARYYDPETGRFLQTDPIGYEDQMNLYAYVGNDPVNMFDPSGESSIKVRFRDQPIYYEGPRGKKRKIPQAISGGHSGVVTINDETGFTRYDEFGRYNGSSGTVRNQTIPNLKLDKKGVPTERSVRRLLRRLIDIGAAAGSDSITITYTLGTDFNAMQGEVDNWRDRNWRPGQTCHDFCRRVDRAGGRGPSITRELNSKNIRSVASDIVDLYKDNNWSIDGDTVTGNRCNGRADCPR